MDRAANSIRLVETRVVIRSQTKLPATLGDSFTYREALAAGISNGSLRRMRLESPIRGIFLRPVAGFEKTDGKLPHPLQLWRRRQMLIFEAFLRSGESRSAHFAIGATACALWGLPYPVRDPSQNTIEVATFNRKAVAAGRGIHARLLSPALVQIAEVRGLPVTCPATTWAQLAPNLALRDAVALGDAILHHHRIANTNRFQGRPLGTIDQLLRAVDKPGRHGRKRLHSMIGLLVRQSASPPESHLRLKLLQWGLPPVTLDFDVFDAAGDFIGCSEIVFEKHKVALEYEGAHHLTDTRQWNRDIDKYAAYAEAGWLVVRVSADLLYRRPGELRARISNALRLKGWVG